MIAFRIKPRNKRLAPELGLSAVAVFSLAGAAERGFIADAGRSAPKQISVAFPFIADISGRAATIRLVGAPIPIAAPTYASARRRPKTIRP